MLNSRDRLSRVVVLGGFCISIWLLLPAVTSSANEALPHWRESKSCGVSCCYALLNLMGRQVEYREVLDRVPIGELGSSLASMQSACTELGLGTSSIRATPNSLMGLKPPMIAHMNPYGGFDQGAPGGHYVVLLGFDKHSAYMIEPNFAATVEKEPIGDFFSSWSGVALVPKTVLPQPPSWRIVDFVLGAGAFCLLLLTIFLVFTRQTSRRSTQFFSVTLLVAVAGCTELSDPLGYEQLGVAKTANEPLIAWSVKRDIGALSNGGKGTTEFKIENACDQPIELLVGEASCACTRVSLDKPIVLPQSSVNLRITMAHQGKPGISTGKVIVSAAGHRWSRTFSASVVNMGASLPGYVITVNPAQQTCQTISGTLFLDSADDTYTIDANVSGTALSEYLVADPPAVSEPKKVGTHVERNIKINVHWKEGVELPINEKISGFLDVQVLEIGDPWNTSIPVEILASAKQ